MAPEAALSAFESRRRENVAANAKLLSDAAEVGAKIRRAAVVPPRSNMSNSNRSNASRAPSRKRGFSGVDTAPTRRTTRSSARLAAGGEATPDRQLEAEAAAASEAMIGGNRKRARIDGDLPLSSVAVEGGRWASGGGALDFMAGAQPGVRTFVKEDVEDEDEKEDLKDLRRGLGDLKLYDGWRPNDIKITPERIYALTFHPIRDKPVVFAGDKIGNLGVFDGSQDKPNDDDDSDIPLPQVSVFEMHTRTVSSILSPAHSQNTLFTASYDSSIRCLDLVSQVSSQVWAPDDEDGGSDDPGISCMDMQSTDANLIFFSTLDGSLGRVDRRAKPRTTDFWGLSDHKIGGFAIHPRAPHLIATASLDRTLKIWDTRRMNPDNPDQLSLLGEHGNRLSVSHASWSQSGRITTSSYDDTIKIYDHSASSLSWKPGHEISEDDMEPTAIVRHNNQTGRWVTILKPKWQVDPEDGVEKFAIANMNRFVDVYDGEGSQLAQLEGEGITAVPAVAELHAVRNWVAGGTGSGKLCLWL